MTSTSTVTSTTPSTRWFTLHAVADRLHVGWLTAWRLVRPHRDKCHLARKGSHPRLVLWVPAEVVAEIERAQERKRTQFHMKH